jgi:hypothetical protein
MRNAASFDWNACDFASSGISPQKRGPSRRRISAERRDASPTGNNNILVRIHTAKIASMLRNWKCEIRTAISTNSGTPENGPRKKGHGHPMGEPSSGMAQIFLRKARNYLQTPPRPQTPEPWLPPAQLKNGSCETMTLS